jgi:predicted RNase H-like HicB family nuclease
MAFTGVGIPSPVNVTYSEAGRSQAVSRFMKRYAIVIERAISNYAGYVPDLPGCVATGATAAETESLLREAIELHIEGMREDGIEVPEPSSQVEYIEVNA